MIMVDAVVEYEYIGQEADELTLKVGDIITNVDKQEGGWWEGDLNGKRGVFPDNFVKEIKREPREKASNKEIVSTTSGQKKAANVSSHVAELANKLGKGGGLKMGLPTPGIIKRGDPNRKRLRAKAAFSYTPENDDELALEVGEVIEITKQEEEGWWEGILNGKHGVFPSNFVEILDGESDKQGEHEETSNPNTPQGEDVMIHGRKVKGVGLGNIFSQGPIKLRNTSQDPENHSKEHNLEQHKKKNPPTVNKEAPNAPARVNRDSRNHKYCERARVLFSYEAENEDELTIEEGQIITVIEKELEDSGWWKGEINGQTGVFPDNFVELLPVEEQPKPKKPPPPALPPGVNIKSKPAAPDPNRNDKHLKTKEEPKDEKLAKAGHSLNSKKPSLPPPIGKKPNKAADPKLIAQTDDHKAHQNLKSEVNFDGVESSEKLTHPTVNRAKAPQRRPPSLMRDQAHNREVAQGSDDNLEEVQNHTETHIESDNSQRDSRKASKRVKSENASKYDSANTEASLEPGKVPPPMVSRPPPPVLKEVADSAISSASSVDNTEVSRESGKSANEAENVQVAELEQKLAQLKASTVSRDMYDSLQAEVNTLRESMAQLKSSFNKKLLDLMNEVDEEKKTRLSMQVEIERVKKLVTS